jgi:hypothetical protein
MQKVTVGSAARSSQQRQIAAEALAAFGLADTTYMLVKLGTTTTFRVWSYQLAVSDWPGGTAGF